MSEYNESDERPPLDTMAPHHQRIDVNGELVPVDAPRALAPKLPAPDTPLMECPSNIGTVSLHDRALRMKCTGPADLDIPTDRPLRISVVKYLVYPDTVTNTDTGEVSSVIRSVLLTADGRTVRTTSPYVAQRIATMASMLTAEEWAAGVAVIITTKASKRYRGGSYHDLQIDMEALS